MKVGVDIGTGSVRSYCEDGTSTCPISRTARGSWICQSSSEIFCAIMKVVPPAASSICFTATCSMVVREKVVVDGKTYLVPYNCQKSSEVCSDVSDTLGDISGGTNDVILWMDHRATSQAQQLNTLLDGTFVKRTIGAFIPELGLPKLKWLSDHVDKQLYCFELYDWFNYVFQVGYNNDMVPMELVEFDYTEGNGIDGSIKGWTASQLSFINTNIKVGKSESLSQQPAKLLYLGDYIGTVNPKILPSCEIYNGGVDCYGGWISSLGIDECVSMVAGTSTCFIFETDTTSEPIDGIWGPFELVKGKQVYSFGQPATGKLFEELLLQFNVTFDQLEHDTQQLEKLHNKSINELIKHYHYYGDKYGNRNPLMDFNMNEMFIDGKNSSEISLAITDPLIKYNLTLEFLAFQTFQLLENLPVKSIVISGSQTRNQRLLQLIHITTGKDIYVVDGDHSLNVAKGALLLCHDKPPPALFHKLLFNIPPNQARVLNIKKGLIHDMINMQTKFRQLLS